MPVTVADVRELLWPRDVPGLQRHGRFGDGGHVVPAEAWQRAGAMLSCGLGMEWSFERAFAADHPSAPIHVYDASVGPGRYLTAGCLALLSAPFSRHSRTRLRACLDYFGFFRERVRHIRRHVGNGPAQVSLGPAIQRLPPAVSLLLKMDIEGGEYALLPQLVQYAGRLGVMVIEFHDIASHTDDIASFVRQMQETHLVAHLHGNNYSPWCADGTLTTSIEVTFVCRTADAHPPYPHDLPRAGLDAPNSARWPDVLITRG